MTGYQRPIRWGMVGGGKQGFIGAVHRIAARIDNHFVLAAGSFSSKAERNLESAAELGIDPARTYASFTEMAQAEARRDDGIEAVSITTPNHLHYPIAKAFLEEGIHVICEKPVTATLAEAQALARIVAASGRLFILTHNYSGYPLVRHAREMIAAGAIGDIRVVQVEYAQDWLTEPVERSGSSGAAWRTDPSRSGAGGAIGDIGTHAFHLAGFVTGMKPISLLAELTSFVEGRALDDNASILLRYANGASGHLWASQVAVGNENALRLRVYGTKGGIEWYQEEPNKLGHTPFGQPKNLITRGSAVAGPAAIRTTRLPAGHPEGYLEAFATIYTEAALAIRARQSDATQLPAAAYPSISDGVQGLEFIEASIASSKANGQWVSLSSITL
jgi:predicted dehydrogenase